MNGTLHSAGWWLALGASLFAWLLMAGARVAFRLVGPVTIGALVERIGEENTEFLRKSLRAPTAFWFSLTLASGATMLLVLVLLFSAPPMDLATPPAGGFLWGLATYCVLLAVVVSVELVLPVVLARVDRLAFVQRTLPILWMKQIVSAFP